MQIADTRKVKLASLGGDPDQPFELAFASLAHTYLKDKAPSLLQHVVGFQLLDRNQDNTKAAGIFGARVGNQWIYCPAFFLNGEMKGHELMWVKAQNIFLPLKENWINYMTGSRPQSLGEPARVTRQQAGERQPDLQPFIRPPTGKYAMEMPEFNAEFGLDAVKSFAKIAMSAEDRPAFAEVRRAIPTLPTIFKASPAMAKVASGWARSCPQFAWSYEKMHGKQALADMHKSAAAYSPRPVQSLLKSAEQLNVEAGGSLLSGSLLSGLTPKPIVKRANAKLDIRVGVNSNSPDLTDDERSRLLRDGVLVMDKRAASEISTAFDDGTPSSMTNPTESGQYKVLLSNGELTRCLVVLNPIQGHKTNGAAIVVAIDGGREKEFANTTRSTVFVLNGSAEKEDASSLKSVVDKLTSSKTLEPGCGYILFLPDGKAVGILHVTDKAGPRRYEVSCCSSGPSSSYGDNGSDSQLLHPEIPVIEPYLKTRESNYKRFDFVEFNNREGAGMTFVGDTLLVPSATKVMKLYSKQGDGSDSNWRRKPASLGLGDLMTAQEKLTSNTVGLRVIRRGDMFHVEQGRTKLAMTSAGHLPEVVERTKLAAFRHLMQYHGLSEKVAKHLITKADDGFVARCRVKHAYGYGAPYMTDEGSDAPAFPESPYGGSEPYSGAQMLESSEQRVPSESQRSQPDQMTPMDMHMQQPDMELMKQTTDAANSGQRELFDTTALKGLLKSVREDSLINRHLPDLMTALDKCGRLMFMFYWHGTAFAERYGKSDMPELEDMLRNVFESLGDLVLFLREKEIRPFGAGETFSPDITSGADN